MLEIKSNINWLIGPLAFASLNTAKKKKKKAKKQFHPCKGQRLPDHLSRERIIINSLFGAFIEKCMLMASFKPNLNIKGGKGSGKRKRG